MSLGRILGCGLLLISGIATAQSPAGSSPSSNPSAPQAQPPVEAPQPPSYANFSIMLVNPVVGGASVVLMHNPKNELEFVEVNNTQRALSAGYVPVRAIELGEFIASMKEENARLVAENARLQNDQARKAAAAASALTSPDQAETAAQMRAQIDAEKTTQRRQLIQSWLMLQNMNRPQTLNLNVTDCTRSPALCAGK